MIENEKKTKKKSGKWRRGEGPVRQDIHICSPTCPHISSTPTARSGSVAWPLPLLFDGWGVPLHLSPFPFRLHFIFHFFYNIQDFVICI